MTISDFYAKKVKRLPECNQTVDFMNFSFFLPYVALLMVSAASLASSAEINPPIGDHTNPLADELALGRNFATNDPVVLTSYFYWYDVYSGAHLVNADGSDALTDHPPTLTGFSYKSTSWHVSQLRDMMAAGIDVLMPVYWGEPSQRRPRKPIINQPWSFSGLPPLVQARQQLLDAGEKPPSIGMFYDTSTLEYNVSGRRIDLTTDDGRRWFYESIRDFFSLIPARHWAMVDGKPIIFLYSAAFAAAHDQSCIDYVRQEFAKDFSGRVPYIVREISWSVSADNTYAWGGAISLRNPGVAALGPGYDHSAVPGRTPLIVPREDGAFFERNWIRFLRAPSRLVHVETWNEYHEGTDIAASLEYGRRYIELNRKYADMFRAGIRPPRPRGPFSEVKTVDTTLAATNVSRGLKQFEAADGATVPATAAGSACRAVTATEHAGRYVYFQIDESYKWSDSMLVDVEVEYLDEGLGSFRIEYDGPDPSAPFNGAYTASKTITTLIDSGVWKTAKFRLSGARFLNSQNGGADFRIVVQSPAFLLRKVAVTRLGMPAESGAVLRGWQQDFAEPLGTNWTTSGEPNSFRQAGGILRAGPAAEPSTLLAATGPAATMPREILARIRVLSPNLNAGWIGGVLVASGDAGGELCSVLLGRVTGGSTQLGIFLGGETSGTVETFSWQTNQWYWLRVRHDAKALPGYSDVLARVWPADGETQEPAGWTVWRDYFPPGQPIPGHSGFTAGNGVWEVDWLLLKSDDQPLMFAVPPPRKPALATLDPDLSTNGMQITLRGDPGIGYVLETSSDLSSWSGAAITADSSGVAVFVDAQFPSNTRFYRARLVE